MKFLIVMALILSQLVGVAFAQTEETTIEQISVQVMNRKWAEIKSVQYLQDKLALTVDANHSGWQILAKVQSNSSDTFINNVQLATDFVNVYTDTSNQTSVEVAISVAGNAPVGFDIMAVAVDEVVVNPINVSLGPDEDAVKKQIATLAPGMSAEISARFAKWVVQPSHKRAYDNLSDVLKIASYICKQSRRNSPCEHAFVIADEMDTYMKTHPGARFASGWERATRVIAAESSYCYWDKNSRSTAAGLWQFLDSTCGWFGAKEIQDVNATLKSIQKTPEVEARVGGLGCALWATTQTQVYQLMRPAPGAKGVPTIESPRSDAFQRLVKQQLDKGLNENDAFNAAVEDMLRFQTAMGARLLDKEGWSQWEVCTRYGV